MPTSRTPPAAKKEQWQLTFEKAGPADRGPPTVGLIRQLLKTALRAYGLRCVQHRMSQAGHAPPVDPAYDASRIEPPF